MRWLVVLMVFGACNHVSGGGGGGGGGDTPPPDAPTGASLGVFDPSITKVDIEIDYETGQAPFTGPILGFGDSFDITANNIGRLFAGKKLLQLPRTTADMQDVGDIPDEELTVDDILALAAAHRDKHDAAGVKTYYVIFVSGHFTDANGPNTQVLGVSIGSTGVLAMFKDVIRSTNVTGTNVQRFVEQSTLTHELGHAIGLVDNGVHMTAAHKDEAHGAHCTNDRCVMYYVNEGASAMAQFAQQYVISGNSILFGAECLSDVDAINGS